MKRLKNKKSGSAIVLVIFAILILFITGVSLLKLGLVSRVYAIRNTAQTRARCAADSGLTKALFEMNEKLKVKPWNDSSLPSDANVALENCDATFGYSVTGTLGSGYTIESTGNSLQVQKTVSTTLQLAGAFEFAVFGDEGLTMYNSSIIDWYNYDSDDKSLRIGTNSTEGNAVLIKSSASINGDVLVGINGNPDQVIDNKGTVTGQQRAMTEQNILTSVTVPLALQSLPSGGTIQNDTTITTSSKYTEIDLKNNKTITVDGPVSLYVTGNVTLNNNAQIKVVNTNPDAYLKLYMGGNFEGKNGSSMNNLTNNSKKLQIYGLDTCQNMDFKNSTNLYGTIYAPKADVTFYNSANAYGSVVAESFEQKNDMAFYYDASLRDVQVNDELVEFTVNRWSED